MMVKDYKVSAVYIFIVKALWIPKPRWLIWALYSLQVVSEPRWLIWAFGLNSQTLSDFWLVALF